MTNDSVRIIWHNIDVAHFHEGWAYFSNVESTQSKAGEINATIKDLLEGQAGHLARRLVYPVLKFDCRDGLSLFIKSDEAQGQLAYFFELDEDYGDKDGPISPRFDQDRPFQFGDAGWDVSPFISNVTVFNGGRNASFVIDMDALSSSEAYINAKDLGAPYVRFPLLYRVVTNVIQIPPGMIPNHHSPSDMNRFGDVMHASSLQEHDREHKKDHVEHQGEKRQIPFLRHWGPHFMESYCFYVQLPN